MLVVMHPEHAHPDPDLFLLPLDDMSPTMGIHFCIPLSRPLSFGCFPMFHL
jgi:hypothetical protein